MAARAWPKVSPYLSKTGRHKKFEGKTFSCPNCGSEKIKPRSFFWTRARYKCTECLYEWFRNDD